MNLFSLLHRFGTGPSDGGPGHAPLPLLPQRGFTLVELSVSMAIGAILAVASLEVLRQQLDQAQVSSSSQFLQQTMVSLQNFFANDDGSAPINNSALPNGAAVPRQYVGASAGALTQITNTWGGRLFLGPLNGGTRTAWLLQASGLPMRLCADIVQNLESTLNTAGLRHALAGAATNGADVTTSAPRAVELTANRTLIPSLADVHVIKSDPYAPLNPATLSTLCEADQPYFTLFLTGNNHAL